MSTASDGHARRAPETFLMSLAAATSGKTFHQPAARRPDLRHTRIHPGGPNAAPNPDYYSLKENHRLGNPQLRVQLQPKGPQDLGGVAEIFAHALIQPAQGTPIEWTSRIIPMITKQVHASLDQ